MNLLVVTPFYAPDLGPSAPLVTMLCEDLAALGHQVTVLAAVPHFPDGQVAAEYRGRLWQWEERNGVRVGRVWIPSGNRVNLYHRLFAFLVFQVLVTFIGLSLSYDAALITNPALETFLPFVFLGHLRGKPGLFCVWDVYPDVGIHLGVFRHPAVIKVVETLENFCLRRATIIQVLSKSFIHSLLARGITTTKITVIPPWLDTDFIHPLPRCNTFSREHDLDNYFVILYAGNLGLSQGLENVLLAAQTLNSRLDLRFVIIGDGPNRASLIAQAKELGLTNVKFMPFQPRERLPELLATADLALVSQQNGLGYDSLPSKIFPILASGRPILANSSEDSGLAHLIQVTRAGICVSPDNPVALAQAISALIQKPAECQQMGYRGREYAVRFHARIEAARQFAYTLKTAIDCFGESQNG